jgi:hypothetical protein
LYYPEEELMSDGLYHPSQFDDIDTIITQTGRLFKDIQQFDDITLDSRVP